MSLVENENYDTLILNERCSCMTATSHDVSFNYVEDMESKSTFASRVCENVDIAKLKYVQPDDTYYSVQGKIVN